LIEEAVLQRTLQTALRHGGDFAGGVRGRPSTASARLDDAKVEEFVSGRERGAGIRVVRGESTGFAHTADLSEWVAGGGRRRGGGGAGSRGRDRASPTSSGARSRRRTSSPCCPSRSPKARKAEVLERADHAARSVSDSIRQVSASYADSGAGC